MSTLALAVATAVVCAPAAIHLTPKVMQEAAWKIPAHSILIAQKYAGSDPHGDDPHGDDPHDENHDSNMKANADQKANKAPKDEYGNTVPNSSTPY